MSQQSDLETESVPSAGSGQGPNRTKDARGAALASPTVQEYLEALHNLESKGRPVRPVSIATRLGVSASAVSEMLKRLRSEGLIERTADQGALLTEKGRREASRMVRRHRLAERFLVDILGLPWYGAHEEACKLEHALSAESEEGLARLLGDVETCPHGNPIPDAEGNVAEERSEALCDLQPRESGRIVKITDESHAELQHLATLGLLPGVNVTVEERAPFSGPILVSVGRAKYALGRDIAARIWVGRDLDQERGMGHYHQHRHRHGQGFADD
jgi:DtxR family transcriptional regulator, Mn-dependent transcriptional regulator